jgi:hypothetical protein
MTADEWERQLAAYKAEFINSQGWNKKQAASYIRDAWANLNDGKLEILVEKGENSANALPVFQYRTPLGWKLPPPLRLHVWEQLRAQANDFLRRLTPREQVFAMIAEQGLPPEGDLPEGQFGESELKRIMAQQAAADLELICDCDEFETASDRFFQAILAAIRFGQRLLLAENYADDQVMDENMRGRLMSRKGTRAKGRKRPKSSLFDFRKYVQSLVAEGLRQKKPAKEIWPFVRRSLLREKVSRKKSHFVYEDRMRAKEATVQKWVRLSLKSLVL